MNKEKSQKKQYNDVNGILLLNKSAGVSSNQSLQKVKRIYNAKKAGHTGSLDVPATGLLPICFGEATKVSEYLLRSDKKYFARCRLGETTTTGDAEGDLLERKQIPPSNKLKLEEVLENFIGEIKQTPPMFSALKHQGVRLYKLAYKGISVERKSRCIKIYKINLLNRGSDFFDIEVTCSKGSYIRTLVEDIGKKIGCGAHVLTLNRKISGPFHESDSITLEEIENIARNNPVALSDLLLPMDTALKDIPQIQLKNEEVFSITRGQSINTNGSHKCGKLRMYDSSRQFIGLGEITKDGRVSPKRLINIT